LRRCYLDNAATTFPKPEVVYDAVDQYQRLSGASPGRGVSAAVLSASQVVSRCRSDLARLLGLGQPERLVFGFSGTDLLNTAIQGLLQPGDRVLYTALEHNSVLRPLHELCFRLDLKLVEVPASHLGTVSADAFREALESRPRLAIFSHASNVSGAILPIHDFVDLCVRSGTLTLVDACQSAGHFPFSLSDCPVDLWVSSGHKHLLGPPGTGVLYLRDGLEERVRPFRFGGTGQESQSELQPAGLPQRFEAGTLNAPGLHGLAAAVEWIRTQTLSSLYTHEQRLTQQFLEGLARLPRVTLHGPPLGVPRLGLVSISLTGLDPQESAIILEQSFGIETRAGLHCSPRAHQALGTLAKGGTLRFSFGPFTTPHDIDHALQALAALTDSD